MNPRLSSLILLLHIQRSVTLVDFFVTCERNICAVRGGFVTLKCFHSNFRIKTGFWFSEKKKTSWRTKEEPEDLTLDSDYAGRVNQTISNRHSELRIRDLRERDSGEYQLMFVMIDGVRHLSSVTVNLTVTVPQVKIKRKSIGQRDQGTELICDSSCNFTSESCYWYRNGQFLKQGTQIFVSSSRDTDSYFCSVNSDSNYPSASVCVSKSCWNVTYTSRRVCALVGSTVDISSTYSHPTGLTVVNTFWYFLNGRFWEFRDMGETQQFAGRVENLRNTLRIKGVKTSDSGEYRFRIITNTTDGKYSGLPGVILTVTDTQVTSSPNPVIEGEKVILSCLTKCTLNNKYTYIWYKNGARVTGGFTLLNKLYLDSVSSEEIQEYSCAVGEAMGSSASGHHTVCLLVFLPQFLIIGAVWTWFLIRMNKQNNRTDDKN